MRKLWPLYAKYRLRRDGVIEIDQIRLREYLSRYLPPQQVLDFDPFYRIPSGRALNAMIKADETNRDKYGGTFTYGNFAFKLSNGLSKEFGINSVGVVVDRAAAHAYNIALYYAKADNGISLLHKIIEPQIDRTPVVSIPYEDCDWIIFP